MPVEKGNHESGLPIHTRLEHSFQLDFRSKIAATVTQDKMLTGLVDALWRTLPCKHLNYRAHTPLLVNVAVVVLNCLILC